MRILVTGYAGFIGYHVSKRLIKMDHEVIGIDNFNNFYDHQIKRDRHKKFGDNIEGYEHSILDIGSVDKILGKGIDAVINLAAYAGVRGSLDNPPLYYATNIMGLINILEMCKKNGVKNVVSASSSSVYGENPLAAERGLREDEMADWPISPYACSKRSGELICNNANKYYDMNVSSLRFFTVYGPEQRPDLAICKFVKAAMEKKPIEVYGGYYSHRDYSYVEDIADGIIATLEHNKENDGDVFNLGGGGPVSMANMIEEIESELDTIIEQKVIEPQPGDVTHTWADITKAKKILGWEPKTDFYTGIKKFISWARDSL